MAKILVVDDEAGIRYILRRTLENAGHEVAQADSGEMCLEKFDEVQPDLILMDIMMPGMDGWEACKTIKERRPQDPIPVSMLSVRSDHDDLKKSFEYARADAHLAKPIDMEEVLGTVEKILREVRPSN